MRNAATGATTALFGAAVLLTAGTFGVAAKTDDTNIVEIIVRQATPRP